MKKYKTFHELLDKLNEHSEKSNDDDLKKICQDFKNEVALLDTQEDPPGQNHPEPPDVPGQTT